MHPDMCGCRSLQVVTHTKAIAALLQDVLHERCGAQPTIDLQRTTPEEGFRTQESITWIKKHGPSDDVAGGTPSVASAALATGRRSAAPQHPGQATRPLQEAPAWLLQDPIAQITHSANLNLLAIHISSLSSSKLTGNPDPPAHTAVTQHAVDAPPDPCFLSGVRNGNPETLVLSLAWNSGGGHTRKSGCFCSEQVHTSPRLNIGSNSSRKLT